MGFFGLIPTTTLQARYNTVSKRLILIANGDAVCYTSAITFQREQLLNGLKFSLNGWIGPITGGEQPFSHDQQFDIALPKLEIFPTNTVILVTANYPEGKKVDIDYFVGEPLPGDSTGPASVASVNDDSVIPVGIVTNPNGATSRSDASEQQLTKLFKVPFQITESLLLKDPLSTINLGFDSNHLQLTDSAIVSGQQIAWTFNSLQTGETQIIVTARGGGGTEVLIKTIYDLSIVLPTNIRHSPISPTPGHLTSPSKPTVSATFPGTDATDGPRPVDTPKAPHHIPLPVPKSISTTTTVTPPTPHPTTTATDPSDGHLPVGLPTGAHPTHISWLTFVNIGVSLLKATYPLGCELLEIHAVPSTPDPVTQPAQLGNLTIIARVIISRSTPPTTAILRSTGWGSFAAPGLSVEPWLGSDVIEWDPAAPPKTDIETALKSVQDSGFKDSVGGVVLRKPIYAGVTEAYYIFYFGNGDFVGVGWDDGVLVRLGRGNLGFEGLVAEGSSAGSK